MYRRTLTAEEARGGLGSELGGKRLHVLFSQYLIKVVSLSSQVSDSCVTPTCMAYTIMVPEVTFFKILTGNFLNFLD